MGGGDGENGPLRCCQAGRHAGLGLVIMNLFLLCPCWFFFYWGDACWGGGGEIERERAWDENVGCQRRRGGG